MPCPAVWYSIVDPRFDPRLIRLPHTARQRIEAKVRCNMPNGMTGLCVPVCPRPLTGRPKGINTTAALSVHQHGIEAAPSVKNCDSCARRRARIGPLARRG
jgi:hypothetical protein